MKIKILIINNSTVPQKNLENFLSNYGEVSSEKEMYKDEIEFIQTSHCPIIGICFGFEAIAISQNEQLTKSKEKIYGLKEIILDKNFFSIQKATVWQNHSWCLMTAKALNVISESVNGHEIIKIPGKQIYGIQFHPEHIDPKNDGKEVFNEILEEIFEVNKI